MRLQMKRYRLSASQPMGMRRAPTWVAANGRPATKYPPHDVETNGQATTVPPMPKQSAHNIVDMLPISGRRHSARDDDAVRDGIPSHSCDADTGAAVKCLPTSPASARQAVRYRIPYIEHPYCRRRRGVIEQMHRVSILGCGQLTMKLPCLRCFRLRLDSHDNINRCRRRQFDQGGIGRRTHHMFSFYNFSCGKILDRRRRGDDMASRPSCHGNEGLSDASSRPNACMPARAPLICGILCWPHAASLDKE